MSINDWCTLSMDAPDPIFLDLAGPDFEILIIEIREERKSLMTLAICYIIEI